MEEGVEVYPMPTFPTLAVGDAGASVGWYSEDVGVWDGVCVAGVGWGAGDGSPAAVGDAGCWCMVGRRRIGCSRGMSLGGLCG